MVKKPKPWIQAAVSPLLPHWLALIQQVAEYTAATAHDTVDDGVCCHGIPAEFWPAAPEPTASHAAAHRALAERTDLLHDS